MLRALKFLMVNVFAVANSFTVCLLAMEHLSEVVLCRKPLGRHLYLFLFLNKKGYVSSHRCKQCSGYSSGVKLTMQLLLNSSKFFSCDWLFSNLIPPKLQMH